jgi:acyl-CoA thioesterase
MRKFLIPVVAAASLLAVAAPAFAQWAPPARYDQPDNYRGSNELNFPRAMQARVERIRSEIRGMQARRILSWREARSLDDQATRVQQRLWRSARDGLRPDEARRIENDIRRLELRVSREAGDRDNRPGYGRY